jgi:hypothetical protein
LASQKRAIPPISIVPLPWSGRKEARNVRPDGHHPRRDLTIAHFC